MYRREFRLAAKLCLPLVAGGLLLLTGCPEDNPPAKKPGTSPSTAARAHDDRDDDHHDHDHEPGDHHHHAEKGPHGGALVAIGEDAAHLEFVLDAATGKLTAYVLDAAAEKAVPIKQANLQLTYSLTMVEGIEKESDDIPDDVLILALEAVSPAADGTAAEFAGQADTLKGVEKFTAVLTTVNVAGKPYPNVSFNYPEGNEEDHHH
jgi:hypothetical protein